MAKVTGLNCIDEAGYQVLCDPFGNNVAFRCPACGGPVLSIIIENQRGSEEGNPSVCPACKNRYWIELREEDQLLVLHAIKAWMESNLEL